MAEQPERITVTLSHDEWQWVLSLVMNSAYIRAKPIVEATEAAVKNHREILQAAALRERGEVDELRRKERNYDNNVGVLQREASEARRYIGKLERQIDGYKGKLSQMGKRRKVNGHDEADAAMVELQATLTAEALARHEAERSLQESRRTIGLLQERIRTGEWPGGVEIAKDEPDNAPKDD